MREVISKLEPERRTTDIGSNVTDEQAVDHLDHFGDAAFLRDGIDSLALLLTQRSIDHRPDMLALPCSYIADMVVMVVQSATGRMYMQIVMTGRVASIVLSPA
jgi:hypothetical protein